MAKSTFDVAMDRLLPIEGGYVNPSAAADPGGETKFGISKRSYPRLNIKTLTWADAKAIYFRDFWKPIQGDMIPRAAAYLMLDAAINSGPDQALRWLQQALDVADDGKFGPVSRAALFAADIHDVVLRAIAARLDFMSRLSNWPQNGRGWARRIAEVMRYAAEDN